VLGVVATAAGTVTYFRLIVAAGPTFVSGTNYLIPLVAVGMGVLLLGEHPSWRAFAALAMILAGLALSQIRSSSPVTESRSR
jgi:drug/metabolite transporter (DMT)-like permease